MFVFETKNQYSGKMSGAVYQPTTVTYESNGQQERWQDRPISYLASSVTQTGRRPCGLSGLPSKFFWIILIWSCITFFAVGLYMLIRGALDYAESTNSGSESSYLVLIISGAIFFVLSVLLFVLIIGLARRKCWRTAKDHMGTSGGLAHTVNPSTDLLVATQYAPVSEVAYQPAQQEDTERSELMPQENKELTNEDTDRMVESDPRIVLRPLNTPAHEEN